jgi:hypothetical protein
MSVCLRLLVLPSQVAPIYWCCQHKEHGNGRTVFIGGSNLGKIAKAAAEKGSLVVDLTASGWSPKPGNIKKIAEILKNLNLKPCDTIVIDAMANSAYFGTDENGLPMPPAKSGEDGRHHMIGDLQLAPTAVFKTNIKQIESLLEQGGGGQNWSYWSRCLDTCGTRAAATAGTSQTKARKTSMKNFSAQKKDCSMPRRLGTEPERQR